jgi:Tfp pilus assembly protein PilF
MNQSRIEQLFKFLETNPNDSFVKFALALEYISESDDERALKYFTEIQQYDPDYTGVYYHLGKLHERQKEKKLAEEAYREGMKRTIGKDQKTYHELQEAMNQLLYDEE